MARTKTPKDLSSNPAVVEQILSQIFPSPGKIDLAKMFELVETIPPPKGMSKVAWQAMLGQVAAASFASGLSANNDEQQSALIDEEHIFKGIFTNQDATRPFKDLRNKFRITQAEIAQRVGVERSLVVKWEQGKAPIPFKAMHALREIVASRTEPTLLTGNIIAKLRKLLGMTQANFASEVGTSSVSVRKWEKLGEKPLTRDASAKVHKCYAEQLQRYAEELNA